MNKQNSFTLAEVLITLTIIGIIAALTIPNLMQKHMQKELEAGFKKATANINQALSLWAYDEGAGLKQRYATYDSINKIYSNNGDPSNFWNYINIEDYKFKDNFVIIYYKNYNNTSQEYRQIYNKNIKVNGLARKQGWMTKDGMFVDIWVSSSQIFIMADTNGLKGPNRLGYDFWMFRVSDQDTLTHTGPLVGAYDKYGLCDNTNTDKQNGQGCAKYAFINKCPYDESKTYWECLK